jgi:hypothetical protein
MSKTAAPWLPSSEIGELVMSYRSKAGRTNKDRSDDDGVLRGSLWRIRMPSVAVEAE